MAVWILIIWQNRNILSSKQKMVKRTISRIFHQANWGCYLILFLRRLLSLFLCDALKRTLWTRAFRLQKVHLPTFFLRFAQVKYKVVYNRKLLNYSLCIFKVEVSNHHIMADDIQYGMETIVAHFLCCRKYRIIRKCYK